MPDDPVLELLYLQAGCQARRAQHRDRTVSVLGRVDFERLTIGLASRRMLPLIGSRLVTVGGDRCPPHFHEAVSRACRTARVRGLVIETATHTVVRTLEAAGISALPLKGPLLAEAAHGDLGLRETNDIDLLVPRPRLFEASELMVGQGWRAPGDPLRRNGLPDLHLTLEAPSHPSLEVHWRVHWDEQEFSQQMLTRSRLADDGLRRATAEDFAVAMLLFHARDGLQGVRLASDLSAWWDRHSKSLPPGFLKQYATQHPSLAPALSAAAAVMDGLTGTAFLAHLGSARDPGRRTELAVRLGDWAQTSDRDQLVANVSLTSLLLGSGSGGTFVRREMSAGDAGAVAPHAAKTIGRYMLALWRLRRGRTWTEIPPSGAQR